MDIPTEINRFHERRTPMRSTQLVCSPGSGLQAGPRAQVDITSRLSKPKLRFVEAPRATALPDIAVQDLEVLDLVGAGGYGHVYRYVTTKLQNVV